MGRRTAGANDEIGGAVRSSTDVDASFVHDTFSSFYPLAAVSPRLKNLHLGDYGLEWSNAPALPATNTQWRLGSRPP
jgi:phytoene dehydrogenase-like protein